MLRLMNTTVLKVFSNSRWKILCNWKANKCFLFLGHTALLWLGCLVLLSCWVSTPWWNGNGEHGIVERVKLPVNSNTCNGGTSPGAEMSSCGG